MPVDPEAATPNPSHMDDQAADPGDDDPIEGPVSTWLDELAESEGLTRPEALEQLVSSYWRLEEISTLLAEDGAGSADRPDPPGDGHPDWPAAGLGSGAQADGRADFDRLVALVAVLADRVQGLESTLTERVGGDPETAADDDSTGELETLIERVEVLDAAVAELEEKAATRQELVDEIDRTRESITLRMGQEEPFRDLVRTEFEHIRTILEHLVESTGSTEGRTEQLAAELRRSVRPHLTDHERVAALKRTANREGVRSAECERCGLSIDLSLLESPACPGCEADLADLEASTGVFGLFRRAVLTTAAD